MCNARWVWNQLLVSLFQLIILLVYIALGHYLHLVMCHLDWFWLWGGPSSNTSLLLRSKMDHIGIMDHVFWAMSCMWMVISLMFANNYYVLHCWVCVVSNASSTTLPKIHLTSGRSLGAISSTVMLLTFIMRHLTVLLILAQQMILGPPEIWWLYLSASIFLWLISDWANLPLACCPTPTGQVIDDKAMLSYLLWTHTYRAHAVWSWYF